MRYFYSNPPTSGVLHRATIIALSKKAGLRRGMTGAGWTSKSRIATWFDMRMGLLVGAVVCQD